MRSCAATLRERESGINEEVLNIHLSISGALPSDSLVPYKDTRWRESNLCAEMQSVYSIGQANLAAGVPI